MVTFTPTDITLLIAGIIGGISSLILVIQRSTCTKVECCCIKCDRKVRTLEELEAQNNTIDSVLNEDIERRLSDMSHHIITPPVPAEAGAALRAVPIFGERANDGSVRHEVTRPPSIPINPKISPTPPPLRGSVLRAVQHLESRV